MVGSRQQQESVRQALGIASASIGKIWELPTTSIVAIVAAALPIRPVRVHRERWLQVAIRTELSVLAH